MLSHASPVVRLIASPRFHGLPPELGVPREDQLRGTDAEKIIETAGRACYDSFGQGRGSAEYHAHILGVAHGSVLAHAVFVFYIDGISRGLSHELVRHAVGVGISQRSTRYCDESESPWIAHPLLTAFFRAFPGDSLIAEWDAYIEHGRRLYMATVEKLGPFARSIGKNITALAARKQARGAARGALGNALETGMVWSANVRALRWVLSQRASDSADAEIRRLAVAIYNVVRDHAPAYFTDVTGDDAADGLGETLTFAHPKV